MLSDYAVTCQSRTFLPNALVAICLIYNCPCLAKKVVSLVNVTMNCWKFANEVCKDVEVELVLTELSGEVFTQRTAK